MMRRIAIVALLPLASCGPQGQGASERPQELATSTAPLSSREDGRRGTDGDTLMFFLHHVKASKRAEYERWFADVWAPALTAVAEKRQSARRQLRAERDLRPIQAGENGDYIYGYLYDPWVTDTSASQGGFPAGLLMEAGRSAEDAKKQADTYRSLVERDEAYMFVQKQF